MRFVRSSQYAASKIHRSLNPSSSTLSKRPSDCQCWEWPTWHFIVVRDKETLRRLGQLASTGPYIPQAPLAIVVAMNRGPLADSDGSRAIQDMILAAWSQGVGSNWVGFNSLPEVNPLLGIPEEVSVLAILPFGYPAEAVGKGQKKRKPLGEVAYNERWGNPFA